MENPWNKYPDTKPQVYGRYEVYREKCNKQHYRVWNGGAWAYDNNDITHWRKIINPLNQQIL
jgi:hypothetical protein